MRHPCSPCMHACKLCKVTRLFQVGNSASAIPSQAKNAASKSELEAQLASIERQLASSQAGCSQRDERLRAREAEVDGARKQVALLQLQLREASKGTEMLQKEKAVALKALEDARAQVAKLQQQVGSYHHWWWSDLISSFVLSSLLASRHACAEGAAKDRHTLHAESMMNGFHGFQASASLPVLSSSHSRFPALAGVLVFTGACADTS